MAHPFAEHKENKVAHDRVKTITKGYAAGGGVLKSDDLPNSMSKTGGITGAKGATGLPKAVTGKAAKSRLDKPAFAKGGRVNGKTNVNVIIAPGGNQQPPAAPPMPPPMPPPQAAPPAAPPHPPVMPPPGAGAGPGMPPSGLTIRKAGGRVNTKGLGAAKADSLKNGTKVSHTPGKNDLDDLSTKPPALTRKKGGRVYPIDDGAGSGPGRLEKIGKTA